MYVRNQYILDNYWRVLQRSLIFIHVDVHIRSISIKSTFWELLSPPPFLCHAILLRNSKKRKKKTTRYANLITKKAMARLISTNVSPSLSSIWHFLCLVLALHDHIEVFWSKIDHGNEIRMLHVSISWYMNMSFLSITRNVQPMYFYQQLDILYIVVFFVICSIHCSYY